MCLVYKISNKVNGRLYIGVTANSLDNRWERHRDAARSSRDSHRPLYTAMREYGMDQFWIEPIETCPDEPTMYTRELELIRELNTVYPHGYNLAARRLTDEQAAIIRFNAYGWTRKQYAQAFGISLATVNVIRSKYDWRPYKHITRDDLPG